MRRHRTINIRIVVTMIKQGFAVRSFFLCASAIACMLLLSLLAEFAQANRMITEMNAYGEIELSSGYHMQLWLDGSKSSLFLVSLTVLCTLLQSVSCIDEQKCGFQRLLLPRVGYLSYIVGKLLTAIFVGGLVSVVGSLFSYFLLAVFFSRFEPATNLGQTISSLFSNEIRIFLLGAFWSVLGMTASLLFSSRQLAWSFSFLFYYLLEIFVRRFAVSLFWLSPQTWGIVEETGNVNSMIRAYLPLVICLIGTSAIYLSREWQILLGSMKKKMKKRK